MHEPHAQRLQNQAIEALSNLRAWIWAQHASLLPDDVSAVTREQAQRYSVYLEWYTTVEESILALQAAVPASSEPLPAAELAVASTKPAPARSDAPSARAVEKPNERPVEKSVGKLAGEPTAAPAPPTLRVTPAARPTSRSGVWHRTIAVSELAVSEQSAA